MRILIYGINFHPELIGVGKYTGEMAFWLAERGHEVTVITASPFYPAWKVSPGYRPWRYRRETINQVTVIRCPIWVPSQPGGLGRIIHLLSFAISSAPVALFMAFFRRPGLLLAIAPAIIGAPAAWVAARISGALAWLHIQDFEVDAAFMLGIMGKSRLYSIALWVESLILRRFDRVSAISNAMLAKLAVKGVDPAKTALFPNWVDASVIKPSPEGGLRMRERLGIPAGAAVLLYSGNFGKKQGMENLIETAKRMKDAPGVLFLLCGGGVTRRPLAQMAEGMDNVKFIPLQPAETLNDLLNMADIHLLPQRAEAESLVAPSKLLPIMASGKPLIAMAREGSELAAIVSSRGIVVEPDNVDQFHGAIRRLLADMEAGEALGRNGRKYAVENWETGKILGRAFAAFESKTAGA
jgi:colanic acid biosynthesis glycosyl transferase WcaI